ncbi:hypothetical protein NLJ89_g7612 [Agrocybe chaxingu]|uniref:Velvet domain-containing protein n=1 Tax=Agrocybe chaxingu TaxID=84603 RepID=A0A9W8MTI5_9AGAR|nr:hypothetical protein NLJ89_g7612 [Agrocybe chaxingu]
MNAIIQPIKFATGQFANQCIRLGLVEIQAPDVGWKHTRGDIRNLLDPPPVVRLRLFSVDGYGTSTQSETELNYELSTVGLLLSVELLRTQDSVAQLGITEPLNQANLFVGDAYVQPLLIDYQGRRDLLFTMGKFAVKIDGRFHLRYRLYDLFSTQVVQQNDLNFVAECLGAPFNVYSGPNFPGFAASTELTKQLARSGTPVKIRRRNETSSKLPESSA